MRAVMLFLSLSACGRIGIDELPLDNETDDAGTDGAVMVDMMTPLACPADMTRLSASSNICIEIDQRGSAIWLDGKAMCEADGRRYCTDAEWVEGCKNAVGLVDITSDGYEWVAEESGGIAQKRGASTCDDLASHEITDPYQVRCCGPMI